MIPQRAVAWLIAGAVALPIALCVLLGTARLLASMQDQGAAAVLDRIGLAAAILWAVILIGLLVAVAINSVGNSPRPPQGQ